MAKPFKTLMDKMSPERKAAAKKRAKELLAEIDAQEKQDNDVHTRHCCLQCGCKYMDNDCTVKLGKKQEYPCNGDCLY